MGLVYGFWGDGYRAEAANHAAGASYVDARAVLHVGTGNPEYNSNGSRPLIGSAVSRPFLVRHNLLDEVSLMRRPKLVDADLIATPMGMCGV